MSNLYSQVGYSTREFHDLQLIVHMYAVFVSMDYPLGSFMLVHFLEILFETTVSF